VSTHAEDSTGESSWLRSRNTVWPSRPRGRAGRWTCGPPWVGLSWLAVDSAPHVVLRAIRFAGRVEGYYLYERRNEALAP
jgi:hypothetical protein